MAVVISHPIITRNLKITRRFYFFNITSFQKPRYYFYTAKMSGPQYLHFYAGSRAARSCGDQYSSDYLPPSVYNALRNAGSLLPSFGNVQQRERLLSLFRNGFQPQVDWTTQIIQNAFSLAQVTKMRNVTFCRRLFLVSGTFYYLSPLSLLSTQ